MWFRSNVVSIKCRFDQVSFQSSVVSIKYRFNQVSFRSSIVLIKGRFIKCRFNQVSFRSSVVSIKCRYDQVPFRSCVASINCRVTDPGSTAAWIKKDKFSALVLFVSDLEWMPFQTMTTWQMLNKNRFLAFLIFERILRGNIFLYFLKLKLATIVQETSFTNYE